jgi:hypothetical protein
VARRNPRPGDHQCAGIYGPKHRREDKIGQQCELMIPADKEFCHHHFVPEERRCTAHYSPLNPDGKGGQRCVSWAMQGQTICQFHGGRTRRNKTAAARRLAEEKAKRLVDTYGVKITTTATEALLEEVQWTAGHVAWLRQRVQEIETAALEGSSGEHPLVWGTTRRKSGGEDWGETEEAKPSIWLELYQKERTHLVKVCSEAIKAGIEERRVRLAEQQGELVASAIKRILDDLHLTKEQLERVPDIVPRHLRAIAAIAS